MYLGVRRNGLMVSDAGFQDFFSAPYAGFGNVCRRFAAWVFSDSLFARVMDGAVFFCGGCIRYFFGLVRVSAICFWFDLEDGFSMCLCPYLEKTLITRLFPNTDEINPHQSLLMLVDIGFAPKLHNTPLSNATALRNQRRSDCREARSDSKVEHD